MSLTAKEALMVFLTLRYIITVRGSDDSIIFSIVAKFLRVCLLLYYHN